MQLGPTPPLKVVRELASLPHLQVLTSDFLRKYVIFARRRYAKEGVQIEIQDEAAERIVEFYGALRRKSHQER